MGMKNQRAAFEAWAASIGFCVTGKYAETIDVLCAKSAFKAGYQAGRAAQQSQDREDAERWRYWKKWFESDESDGHQYPPEVDLIWHKRPDLTFDEAIDHARRVEGSA